MSPVRFYIMSMKYTHTHTEKSWTKNKNDWLQKDLPGKCIRWETLGVLC